MNTPKTALPDGYRYSTAQECEMHLNGGGVRGAKIDAHGAVIIAISGAPIAYVATYTGGYEAPSFQSFLTEGEAMATAVKWAAIATDSDWVQVLTITDSNGTLITTVRDIPTTAGSGAEETLVNIV